MRSRRRSTTCTTPAPTSSPITQYLRPSPRHLPVDRWVRPEEFVELKAEAEQIGFLGVLAGPARALVVPRGAPLGAVDARQGTRAARRALASRRHLARLRAGGRLSAPPVASDAVHSAVRGGPARRYPRDHGTHQGRIEVRSEGARPHEADVAGLPDDPPLRPDVAVAHAPRLPRARCSSASASRSGSARATASRSPSGSSPACSPVCCSRSSSSAVAPSAPPTRRSRASPARSAPCCAAACAAAGSATRCPSP